MFPSLTCAEEMVSDWASVIIVRRQWQGISVQSMFPCIDTSANFI
jgi:hypothetical protein